jgi:hypothetical protein
MLRDALNINVSKNGAGGLATIGAVQTIHFCKHFVVLGMKLIV